LALLSFNTLYPALDFVCPQCKGELDSGVGFRVGAILRLNYRMGDELIWRGSGPTELRPPEKPPSGNIKTLGYFNCDNPACKSWTDCFPEVQHAVIEIAANKIVGIVSYEMPNDVEVEEFAIFEAD
jgi:hypothetical protein